MTTVLVIGLLLTLAAFAGRVPASSPPAPTLEKLRNARALTDRVRSRKCLSDAARVYRSAAAVPVLERTSALARERVRVRVALSAGKHRCLQNLGPRAAIRYVFGRYAGQALAVAWCESRLYVYARNGQYFGLFQMGSYARSRYGHSWTALGQARSAYRYFVDSGRDWSPWQCRPGGLGW